MFGRIVNSNPKLNINLSVYSIFVSCLYQLFNIIAQMSLQSNAGLTLIGLEDIDERASNQ